MVLVCKLYAPEVGEFDELFDVQVLSIERMLMTNTTTPDQGDTAGVGTVVRVD